MKKTMIKKTISGIAAFSLVIASLVTMPGLAFAQVANPSLGDACDGLDIALVLDTSGSIGDTNMATVRTAAKDFVDAFLTNTPSLFGVVSFSTSATTHLGLTDNQANLDTAIDSLVSSGTTNWAEGLQFGRELLETPPANPDDEDRDDSVNPDLMVVFTDGEPNVGGDPLNDAIAQADLAKGSSSSMPIRIIAVGVGGATQNNLEAITGGVGTSNVATDPGDITLATDVIMTDFENLGATLANLATALCEEPPVDDCGCLGPIDVKNINKDTTVINEVVLGANSGGNTANGGSGGSGGNSGPATVSGSDSDGNSATSGAGGAGGNGGNGGSTTTGSAGASSILANIVNTNSTTITRGGATSVFNGNFSTLVGNGVGAGANSGGDAVKGGSAGSGGTSGPATVSGADDTNTATSGAGGAGGNGGNGGTTSTGIAGVLSNILNQINFNLIVIN